MYRARASPARTPVAEACLGPATLILSDRRRPPEAPEGTPPASPVVPLAGTPAPIDVRSIGRVLVGTPTKFERHPDAGTPPRRLPGDRVSHTAGGAASQMVRRAGHRLRKWGRGRVQRPGRSLGDSGGVS